PNQFVPIPRLIEELWPYEPPAQPVEAVQELVYQVRKTVERTAPRGSVLERNAESYRIIVGPSGLDLYRFERLVRKAADARHAGDLRFASSTLREALDLWRGPPLAGLTFEPLTAARAEITRLNELRLGALVDRIEVELDLGLAEEAVPELEALIREHPLDERLRELLMLALYRSGRQADALSVFQETRSALNDELGIEPGRRLQDLQKSILRHDPELDPVEEASGAATAAPTKRGRTVIVIAEQEAEVDGLLRLSSALARSQLARELIFALVVGESGLLGRASVVAEKWRASLTGQGIEARTAAFTSPSAGADAVRLATREDVDLLLMACPPELAAEGVIPDGLRLVLAEAPCDVALLREGTGDAYAAEQILVPFGGLRHDWTALETAAWVAKALHVPLALLGIDARAENGGRDASSVLADASLLLQQVVGMSAEPRLAAEPQEALLQAADEATLLVVGLPDRWHQSGIGPLRQALARPTRGTLLFVRSGSRPSGLNPPETSPVFRWSVLVKGLPAPQRSA
ncbi:MAG TPA: BTAD domain-containing putative transcriptional regulator, partial [Gaiellaceae bacterium]|nr:BTAD domain-containing putative transcriptional regulator [Gaiellaceae bacterium]